MDEISTMLPSRAMSCGSASRATTNAVVRLASREACQARSSVSSALP